MRYLMAISFIVILFLSGCAEEKVYDVVLSNTSNTQFFDDVHNRTMENVTFLMKNRESIDLMCRIDFEMVNRTDDKSFSEAGISIGAGSVKRLSLSFEMFSGDSDIRIEPVCVELS